MVVIALHRRLGDFNTIQLEMSQDLVNSNVACVSVFGVCPPYDSTYLADAQMLAERGGNV
jgi:hypothetical protein